MVRFFKLPSGATDSANTFLVPKIFIDGIHEYVGLGGRLS